MIPEVLAPAGSPEALRAAVLCGADAVYLGAGRYNARRGAAPFEGEALGQAVAYCHAHGVRVYLTLNTILRQEELPFALEEAAAACACGVDALIVQDAGLAARVRAAAPDMPLHASTQFSCHSPGGVRELAAAGMRRVVLAREMTREEIAACAGLGCELEVFVHGAHCMSVSGQCYLSAMLGGRSGNRGLCAQPCRLPFVRGRNGRPVEGRDAALSLRDRSLLAHVGELAALGVASLKIEGRLKRPEYVAAAVTAYRAAVRGETPDPALVADLQAVFSRSGFTDGYYTGRRTAEMFGRRTREDVVAAPPVLARLRRLYEKEAPRLPVCFRLTAEAGRPASLTVTDGLHTVEMAGPVPEPAVHRPLDGDRAADQLGKTGGTPFLAADTVCTIGAGLTLPLSALNHMRRAALDELLRQRGLPQPIHFKDGGMIGADAPSAGEAFRRRGDGPRLFARFARADQVPQGHGLDGIFLPLDTPAAGWARHTAQGFTGVEIPRGLFGTEEAVRAALRRAKEAGAACALCGNIAAVALAREVGLLPVGGFGLNVANSDALGFYARRGLAAATLSVELAYAQMGFARQGPLPAGFVAYGRLPLMLLRACPVGAGGCKGPGPACALTDRKGMVHPLQCAGGCTELLSAVPLYLADEPQRWPALDFLLLHFTDETSARAAQVIGAYRRGEAATGAFTRGRTRHGVD